MYQEKTNQCLFIIYNLDSHCVGTEVEIENSDTNEILNPFKSQLLILSCCVDNISTSYPHTITKLRV
jgi:hypothetical protein